MRFLYRWAPLHLENICRTVPPKRRLPSAATTNRLQEPDVFVRKTAWSIPMMDLILVALGLAFFVLTVGYAYACERL